MQNICFEGYMVVEYLEQTKKQFIDKRESLLDEISSLEIKSKENK